MVADYTDYALGYTGNQTMADTNNHNGALTLNSPTQTVNIITSPLLTQNNKEFTNVDKMQGEDDVLVPVNKRESSSKDLGHIFGEYVKYDLLSLDYDSLESFRKAINQLGYSSEKEFIAAYDKDPSILKDKQHGLIENMTFFSNSKIIRNQGEADEIMLGDTGTWKMINDYRGKDKKSMTDGSVKYRFGIYDINTNPQIDGGISTNSDNEQHKAIRLHVGGPTWSEGCITNTCQAFSPNKPNDRIQQQNSFEHYLIENVPSLVNKNEKTYIYLPPKSNK